MEKKLAKDDVDYRNYNEAIDSATNNNKNITSDECIGKMVKAHHQEYSQEDSFLEQTSFNSEQSNSTLLLREASCGTTVSSNNINSINDSDDSAVTDNDDDDDDEYDIDDIGHLRRPQATSSTIIDDCDQNNVSINYRERFENSNYSPKSLTVNAASTVKNDLYDNVECSKQSSKHTVGGLAFEINFNRNNEIVNACDSSSQPSSSTLTSFVLLPPNLKCKGEKFKNNYCTNVENQKDFDESSSLNVHFVKNHNCDKAINSDSKPNNFEIHQLKCLESTATSNQCEKECYSSGFPKKIPNVITFTLRKSDTFDKNINLISSDNISARETEEKDNSMPIDCAQEKSKRLSLSKFNGRSSSSSATATKQIRKHDDDRFSVDSVNNAEVTVINTNRRSQPRQLSESAVYLINRMFEGNNYHQKLHQSDAISEKKNQFCSSIIENYCPSQSSSLNTYSLSQTKPISKPQNFDQSSPPMDATDSLSSFQLKSGAMNLQNNDPILFSIIDDDDVIPDDISDSGTYVVEIDEDGNKHRKPDRDSKNPYPKNSMMLSDDEDDLIEKETISYCDEDSDSINNESNAKSDEDKLEIARRQIDELFSNYEKNQTPRRESTNLNNATFTRCKRSSQKSQSFNYQNTAIDNHLPKPVESNGSEALNTSLDQDKSKKRLSTELLSAFKKINIKLEKTARLGKLSLAEGLKKSDKNDANRCQVKQSSPKSSDNIFTTSSIKCQSEPSTPSLSSMTNKKKIAQPASIINANTNRKCLMTTPINDFSSSHSSNSKQPISDLEYLENNSRPRSESITSNSSNQSTNLRFNRAFALRRARLGIDTAGFETNDRKNLNKIPTKSNFEAPKKQSKLSSFERNDGGRYSLRVPNMRMSATVGSVSPEKIVKQKSPLPLRKPIRYSLGVSPKSDSFTPSNVCKIPTMKCHSTSSSVNSSNENLALSHRAFKESDYCRRRIQKNEIVKPKISYSDNEIVMDGDSSCDENPISTRIGRQSLRQTSLANSRRPPWLKSIKKSHLSLDIRKFVCKVFSSS